MNLLNDNITDKLLQELFNVDPQCPVAISQSLVHLLDKHPVTTEERHALAHKYVAELEEHDLAFRADDVTTRMYITIFGRKVQKAGGWVQYNQTLQEEKGKLEREKATDKQNVIESLKQEKSSARATWVASLAALMSIAISLYQCVDSHNKGEELRKLSNRVDSFLTSKRVFLSPAVEKPKSSTASHKRY